ncbi:hypothetical protein [Trichothermofontia sp.]
MKTLIITVGTRQVGWRCRDGVVRSLGADGDRGHPPHVDELYAEVGQERGYHGDDPKPEFRYSVRHLGEILYRQCVQAQDFSPVELILDGVILADQVPQGLRQIILWGTDQPESVPWNFRRGDTLWLAELMAGKIRQDYPQVEVEVWAPQVAVNEVASIRQAIEAFLLNYVKQHFTQDPEAGLTLQVQTKGSVPQVANALEMCAATLLRQCAVEQVVPQEPSPAFEEVGETARQVRSATTFNQINLGEYFWPVERERILSAWERGDFTEAKVWLETHRDRRPALYALADYLALATNWQMEDAFKQLRNWVATKKGRQLMPTGMHTQVQDYIAQICAPPQKNRINQLLKIWESTFLIWLELKRHHVSIAFIYFSQTLERLLFLRSKLEDWIGEGYIKLPEDKKSWGKNYKASFGELWRAWQGIAQLEDQAPLIKQFQQINELRNSAVHRGESLTLGDLKSKLFPGIAHADAETIYQAMEELLREVCVADWPIPEQPVLRSLYQWGLDSLGQD